MKTVFALLLTLSSLAGQEKAPAAQALLAHDAAAHELFRAAAAKQLTKGGEFSIMSFNANVQLELISEKKGGGSRTNSARVEWRYWRRHVPNRRKTRMVTRESYWRHLVQPDGKEVWMASHLSRMQFKEKGQSTVDLSTADKREDRRQLEDEMHQAARLARFLILRRLIDHKDPTVRISFGKRDVEIPLSNKDVVTTEVVWERTVSDGQKEKLSFFVGNDHLVYQVTLHPQDKDQPLELLRFSHHQARKSLDENRELFEQLMVPRVVEFWRGGKKRMVATSRDAKDITFNAHLEDAFFRIPE